MTQLEKMLKFAEKKLGSSYWYGYCQAFVARCYEAGTGVFVSCPSAKESMNRYMIRNTAGDMSPPAGAAVYFYGDGELGRKYGHVALSAGGGVLYDPVSRIVKCRLTSEMHNGYLGWGWLGGVMPEGASEQKNYIATYSPSAPDEDDDVLRVMTVSESGAVGIRRGEALGGLNNSGSPGIFIQNGKNIYAPAVVGEVRLTTSGYISAGMLKFSVLSKTAELVENGCPVSLVYNGAKMFYGYIFDIRIKSDGVADITCYDQLRYLKNKDTEVYSLSYSGLVRNIAHKFHLKIGKIDETEYIIPARAEEDTLLDMLSTAAAITEAHTGNIYVLYDDFGKLTLTSIWNMRIDTVVDYRSFLSCSKRKTIDKNVYNRVVVARDNRENGSREFYIANDTEKQAKWGILQYYRKVNADETNETLLKTAQTILANYNDEGITAEVKMCRGNVRVRGGCVVLTKLSADDKLKYMICEKAEHIFTGGEHFMNLELAGGGSVNGG